MYKALFIASHRLNRSPSQRFRFEQYLEFFNQNGFNCELSCLISDKDDIKFYQQGNYTSKLFILIKSVVKRSLDVLKASQYDIIFIQREAFMIGTIIFERLLKKSKAKIIFDFDDSIWLSNVSDLNTHFRWMKRAGKTSEIINLADMVFAGNRYLADYASKYNKNVKIVPTTINTIEYQGKKEDISKKETICIGWSGSITTIQHFDYAIPFLRKMKNKYGQKVKIKVIGDENYQNSEFQIQGIAWKKENEIKELSSFDIGIMPLPDDHWSKGKCGLKGLQYMALEIPTIMSSVGVNNEIIQDGVNGYLAECENEWVDKLSLLIESEKLRTRIGKAGRKTVLQEYSFDSQKDNYLKYFSEVLKQ